MKRRFICLLASGIAFISAWNSYAAIPNNDHPSTFLGPTLRGGLTGPLTDTSAYSFAGELGVRNLRASATVGWLFLDNQRLKLSGDYLWQNIQYPYFGGNAYQGVTQGSVGALYQYMMPARFAPYLGLGAYYANASTFALDIQTGSYTDSTGGHTFVDTRRIAGSNAAGISPGFSIQPWCGSRLGLDLNYDNVRYIMKYEASQRAVGLGGTLRLNQLLTDRLELGAIAAMRKPFNNYEADLIWNNIAYGGIWALKLFGGYTIGKNTMPNTYNAGFGFDYYLDMHGDTSSTRASTENLMAWMSKPAVYLPQVLAIADEQVSVSP